MIPLTKVLGESSLFVHGTCPADVEIDSVTDDSRKADASTLFVAIKGTSQDGHAFLGEAAQRGCRAALVHDPEAVAPPGLTLLQVENPRRALALVAQYLAGNPTRHMIVVGVTGTNGKTTVTYLMEAIFRAAGWKTGVLGTINYRWDGKDGPQIAPAPQTTPSPIELAARLGQMRQAGVEAVAMEASSHAIEQCRVDGIQFRAAALTNLTQDHLDYHKTMEEYARAKERLFTDVLPAYPKAVAVINLDDPVGRRFSQSTRASRVIGYGMRGKDAALRIGGILLRPRGMTVDVRDSEGRRMRLRTPLICLFNAFNCVTAAGLAMAVDVPAEAIREGIGAMSGAPGRFEFVHSEGAFPVIVDYAHTPDALRQVLLHARGCARKRLIAVFGCGGDRDTGKRPQMGLAAAQIADEVIITNDNPRSENPQAIADQVVEGIKRGRGIMGHYKVALDRREAIQQAIRQARAGDCVVIAGKGHEDYQIVGERKFHFDDREETRAALARR
jgi:UDP-N-acetylmuramyl-tripeptide synthetase